MGSRLDAYERSDKTPDDLPRMFNATIRGWINYHGCYYKSALYATLWHIDQIFGAMGSSEVQVLYRAIGGELSNGLPA
jgi:hypothetical protein